MIFVCARVRDSTWGVERGGGNWSQRAAFYMNGGGGQPPAPPPPQAYAGSGAVLHPLLFRKSGTAARTVHKKCYGICRTCRSVSAVYDSRFTYANGGHRHSRSSPAGNRYVLVAGDYFTKWIEAYLIQNQEASTVAQKLLNQLFCRFSRPERLHSDQGRQFRAEIIKQLCKLLQIEKTRTTPYHPQSDGFVERFNRTLLSMLSTRSNPHSTIWDEDLSKVCMVYNTSIQSTTGYSPFFLMFGRDARLPLAIVLEPPPSPHGAIPQQYGNYVQSLQETFNTAFEVVRSNMSTRQGRQKEFYNCNVH